MIKRIIDKINWERYELQKRQHLVIDEYRPVVRYGTRYGGFEVYADQFKNVDNAIIYSFGIGEDLSFSEAILNDQKSFRGGQHLCV